MAETFTVAPCTECKCLTLNSFTTALSAVCRKCCDKIGVGPRVHTTCDPLCGILLDDLVSEMRAARKVNEEYRRVVDFVNVDGRAQALADGARALGVQFALRAHGEDDSPSASTMRVLSSGATRSTDGDDRDHSLTPSALNRYCAIRMKHGEPSHGRYNYKLGMPFSLIVNHLIEHLLDYVDFGIITDIQAVCANVALLAEADERYRAHLGIGTQAGNPAIENNDLVWGVKMVKELEEARVRAARAAADGKGNDKK